MSKKTQKKPVKKTTAKATAKKSTTKAAPKKTTTKAIAKKPTAKAEAKKPPAPAVAKRPVAPAVPKKPVDPRMHLVPGKVDFDDRHTDDFRGDVKEHGFHFCGYEWSSEEQLLQVNLHYDQLYYWKLGELSRMGRGFLDGELWGTQCPICGDKFFPPRVNCWRLDCNLERTNWVRLSCRGVVHTFTVAGWSGRSSLKRLPFVLAYVVLDDCKTAVANELRGLDPWHAEFGMPVKVVWADKKDRRGTITDFHFEPAEGWKPGPMNPEKERIRQLCLPVYEWVKTLK